MQGEGRPPGVNGSSVGVLVTERLRRAGQQRGGGQALVVLDARRAGAAPEKLDAGHGMAKTEKLAFP
jgi:hypothetical protein